MKMVAWWRCSNEWAVDVHASRGGSHPQTPSRRPRHTCYAWCAETGKLGGSPARGLSIPCGHWSPKQGGYIGCAPVPGLPGTGRPDPDNARGVEAPHTEPSDRASMGHLPIERICQMQVGRAASRAAGLATLKTFRSVQRVCSPHPRPEGAATRHVGNLYKTLFLTPAACFPGRLAHRDRQPTCHTRCYTGRITSAGGENTVHLDLDLETLNAPRIGLSRSLAAPSNQDSRTHRRPVRAGDWPLVPRLCPRCYCYGGTRYSCCYLGTREHFCCGGLWMGLVWTPRATLTIQPVTTCPVGLLVRCTGVGFAPGQ